MDTFQYLSGLIQVYGYPIIAVAAFLESAGVPFPGVVLVILGGAAASTGHVNIFWVIVVSSIAAILGMCGGYFIGRKSGKKIIKKLEELHWLHKENIQKMEKYFLAHGHKALFVGRFVSFFGTYLAFVAGVFRMPFHIFFFYNVAGSIVWATAFSLLGFIIGNNFPLLQEILKDFRIIALIVGGIIIISAGVWYFMRKRKA